MSHITKVNLTYKDLDALEEAGKACDLTLKRGQRKFRSYFEGTCMHALVPADKSAYQVGVVATDDGFELRYDAYDGKLEPLAGPGLQKLRREYAAAVTLKRAETTLARKGFHATRENLPGNRIRLRLRTR
ncbi:MAG TPA: hypothetical protein VFN64_11470 [Burkholderiaceae bacterium]|nr:hypothetical protein [Burkholderiaceae bacterium]